MTSQRDMPTGRCRGAVLFEVLVAVALFAGAAAFTLGAVRSVFASLDRLKLKQEAVDLAATKMAELEAGLITLADLRGDAPSASSDQASGHQWSFDLHTSRTEFTGLTLVELTVRETPVGDAENVGMSYTLRQLVALNRPGSHETADDLSEIGDE